MTYRNRCLAPALFAALSLAGLASSGCATAPTVGSMDAYMRAVETPRPLVAPDDRALVVFMRPTTWGFLLAPTIFDGEGRYLGSVATHTYHAVAVAPGEHRFYAVAADVAPLRATLEAGLTYFVRVDFLRGSTRGLNVWLDPVAPDTPYWERRARWLESSRERQVDLAGGQRYFMENAQLVSGNIAAGEAAWQSLSPERRERFTLEPDDGIDLRPTATAAR